MSHASSTPTYPTRKGPGANPVIRLFGFRVGLFPQHRQPTRPSASASGLPRWDEVQGRPPGPTFEESAGASSNSQKTARCRRTGLPPGCAVSSSRPTRSHLPASWAVVRLEMTGMGERIDREFRVPLALEPRRSSAPSTASGQRGIQRAYGHRRAPGVASWVPDGGPLCGPSSAGGSPTDDRAVHCGDVDVVGQPADAALRPRLPVGDHGARRTGQWPA